MAKRSTSATLNIKHTQSDIPYPLVPTGCGKSTVIQLIQRFYDLDGGSLTLEGKDIRSLNLPLVRSNLGIVSQGCNSIEMFLSQNMAQVMKRVLRHL